MLYSTIRFNIQISLFDEAVCVKSTLKDLGSLSDFFFLALLWLQRLCSIAGMHTSLPTAVFSGERFVKEYSYVLYQIDNKWWI